MHGKECRLGKLNCHLSPISPRAFAPSSSPGAEQPAPVPSPVPAVAAGGDSAMPASPPARPLVVLDEASLPFFSDTEIDALLHCLDAQPAGAPLSSEAARAAREFFFIFGLKTLTSPARPNEFSTLVLACSGRMGQSRFVLTRALFAVSNLPPTPPLPSPLLFCPRPRPGDLFQLAQAPCTRKPPSGFPSKEALRDSVASLFRWLAGRRAGATEPKARPQPLPPTTTFPAFLGLAIPAHLLLGLIF